MKTKRNGCIFVLAKIGLKLLPIFAKFGKLISVGKVGLAAASIGAYSLLFTWQFSLILVGSLFFHEFGHFWAMERRGIKTRGIYLIPFLGGVAVPEEKFKTRGNEAFIALLGPVFGLALATIVFVGYLSTHNPYLAAVAGWMGFFNLFNLLPINPLDGGRVIKSIAFSIGSKIGLMVLGVGLLLAMIVAFKFKIFIFGILFFIAFFELIDEYEQNAKDIRLGNIITMIGLKVKISNAMPPMRTWGSIAVATAYCLLIVSLLSLMHLTSHVPGSKAAMDFLVDANVKNSLATTTSHPSTFWTVLSYFLFILLLVVFAWSIAAKVRNANNTISQLQGVEKLLVERPDLATNLRTEIGEIQTDKPFNYQITDAIRRLDSPYSHQKPLLYQLARLFQEVSLEHIG